MSFLISEILGFFILIPGTIALIRFSRINPVYRPFIYCVWLGILNEILSLILMKTGHSNAVNGNIYILAESVLFVWQFYKWGLLKRNFFYFLVLFLFIAWIMLAVVLHQITYFSSYFLVTYSFIISILGIAMLNRMLLSERGPLFKNPVFVICCGFIIYYTFSALAEVFWFYGLNENMHFRMHVINISIITNLIANLLYSFAILWMPAKQRFSLPFL